MLPCPRIYAPIQDAKISSVPRSFNTLSRSLTSSCNNLILFGPVQWSWCFESSDGHGQHGHPSDLVLSLPLNQHNIRLCRFSVNDGTKSEGCPCCPCPAEDSKHLLHCTDPNRIKLLREDVSNLERVLKDLGTDGIFASCIGAYI